MKRIIQKFLILTLILALFWGSTVTAHAAWTNNTLSAAELKELFNAQELHPQKTGYLEFDNQLEAILNTCDGSDTYTKMYTLYTWAVRNVAYNWQGYPYKNASYSSFSLEYLDALHYEDGLQEAMPREIVNRAYHALTQKKGVCYEYAALLAVMARYLGFDAYVQTGVFALETGGYCTHGWCEIVLGDTNYILDAQREMRWTYHGAITSRAYYYFCIPVNGTNNFRYAPHTDANAARNAGFLPVAADRSHNPDITLISSGSGTVSGGGRYPPGTSVTVKAAPAANHVFTGWYDNSGSLLSTSTNYTFPIGDTDMTITGKFTAKVLIEAIASRSGRVSGIGYYAPGEAVRLTASGPLEGWYDGSGNLLSSDSTYSFSASTNRTIYALFTGDHFIDIPSGAWYLQYVMTAVDRGITKGIDALRFDPEGTFTRAMVVEMLSRIEGADTATAAVCDYKDVDQDAWYADAVNWASANGIVNGIGENQFAPNRIITRQDFVTMLGRYLEKYKGIPLESADITFMDAADISAYAEEWVSKAVRIGLVEGYPDNHFRPQGDSTRAEGTTIMVRLDNYLNAA